MMTHLFASCCRKPKRHYGNHSNWVVWTTKDKKCKRERNVQRMVSYFCRGFY